MPPDDGTALPPPGTAGTAGARTLRIALLTADRVVAGLEHFGSLEKIFGDWFRAVASAYFPSLSVSLDNYDVIDGIYPPNPHAYDLLVLTGSESAAFDDDPWIVALRGFLRKTEEEGPRLAAFCFGHQVVHHALGGRAEINPGGREEGRAVVELNGEGRGVLKTGKGAFAVNIGHRDHVAELAPGFVGLGSTPQTPVQGAVLDDRIFTLQVHPEFSSEYFEGYLRVARKAAEAAGEGYDGPTVAEIDAWIESFYPPGKTGGGEYLPTDALWIGAKVVSWAVGGTEGILSDEELEKMAAK
ncbi:class I glutamine amidotransferase-like protein [Hyaloraphidium curvatum]|nr:class I glutamine amidotransferase-like protein [Hyaloraphidium curvatum]